MTHKASDRNFGWKTPTPLNICNELISFPFSGQSPVFIGSAVKIKDLLPLYRIRERNVFTAENLKDELPGRLTDDEWLTYRIYEAIEGGDHGARTPIQQAFFRQSYEADQNVGVVHKAGELQSPDLEKWRSYGAFVFHVVWAYDRLEVNGDELTAVADGEAPVVLTEIIETSRCGRPFGQILVAVDDIYVDGLKLENIVRQRNDMVMIELKQSGQPLGETTDLIETVAKRLRHLKEQPDMEAFQRAELQRELLQ